MFPFLLPILMQLFSCFRLIIDSHHIPLSTLSGVSRVFSVLLSILMQCSNPPISHRVARVESSEWLQYFFPSFFNAKTLHHRRVTPLLEELEDIIHDNREDHVGGVFNPGTEPLAH